MKIIGILILILLSNCGSVISQEILIDPIPRDTSFTLHSAFIKEKKKRPYIQKILPKHPEELISHEHIIYSEPSKNRELRLNIYRPDNKEIYPALIMVHGGGWSSGDLSLQIPMAEQIALHGYVTIPIEYRLSSESKYPAAVYDLKTAVRWVRENADVYAIDTTCIVISGCSAGGQLASLVGTTNGQSKYEDKKEYGKQSSNVHAVINIDGILDFTVPESLKNIEDVISKNKIPAAVKWFGGTIDEKKHLWVEASPLYQITKKSAPICFINSSIPRFHDGRDEMIKSLNKYKIKSKVYTLPDTPHPFWLFDPWFDTTLEYMVYYLNTLK